MSHPRPFDCGPDRYAQAMSGGLWKPYPHLVHMAKAVTEAVLGGDGQLVVNAPTRHGKTELLSFWTPLWFLDNFPESRVILASYQADIAIMSGRKVRNAMERSPRARTRLSEDSTAAGRFDTRQGGGVFCAGVDGALMGRGGDLLIFDDPYKGWQEACSPDVRARTDEWFWTTFYTRRQPGAALIVSGARLHPDDLCGQLERRGSWTVARYPALAEPGDPLGRAVGEPLCPGLWSAAALARIRSELKSEARWAAMFQQAPTGEGTGRLYERFSSRNLDAAIIIDPALPLHLAFDFNISPGMHVEIGQYREADGVFLVADEIYGDALDLVGALDRFERWWRALDARPAEVHVFGDASGHARQVTTSRSCYDLIAAKLSLMRVQHRLRVPRQAPPIRDSVDALNDALTGMDGVPRFFVHPRCERLLADFRELQRSEDGLIDKRNQKLSHGADCARYWCFYIKPAGLDAMPEMPKGRVFSCPQGGFGYTGEEG